MNLLDLFWWSLEAVMIGVCIGSLLGYWGRWWWRLELFGHFRTQYALFLTASTALLGLGGQLFWAEISALFALFNLSQLAPFYLRLPTIFASGRTYRAVTCNVLQENRAYGRVIEMVTAANPDFVLLLEVGPQWIEALQPLRQQYPYAEHHFWPAENFDIAFFSRLPWERLEFKAFGKKGVPTLLAHFRLEGRPLLVIGTHPPPPKSFRQAFDRDQQMDEIAAFAASQEVPVMLMGDLNNTSWTPSFQHLLRRSGLSDSRRGMGLQPSWPTHYPAPLRLPIDHVLVSPQVRVQRRFLGPYVGSDHRPVVVDFSLGI